jgi:hypothetical protein
MPKKKTNRKKGKKNLIRFLKNKQDRQLFWVLIIIVVVIASFLATYFYIQSLKKFEFAGIIWVKEDHNGLIIYHSRFPIIHNGILRSYYNLYARNDPRENNISVNAFYEFYPEVIISNTPEAAECSGAARITGDLSMFLNAIPPILKVSGAVSDKEKADELNLAFANCSSAVNKTVILIQKSETPSIERGLVNRNCYMINIGNCENTAAVERFIIGFIAQLKNKEI